MSRREDVDANDAEGVASKAAAASGTLGVPIGDSAAAAPGASDPPTLYEWIGGLPALERLTTEFYTRVANDSLLGPVFAHMDAHHPRFVAEFLGEVFRGPAAYTADRGGHATMLRQHLDRHLTQEMRRRWVSLLLECADATGIPDDPEFRSAFVSYLEWGSRLAVLNSQGGATPVIDQPMPRWGWGEVGGPYKG